MMFRYVEMFLEPLEGILNTRDVIMIFFVIFDNFWISTDLNRILGQNMVIFAKYRSGPKKAWKNYDNANIS